MSELVDPTPDIAPRDRLSFTVFLAIALHAALILGLGFSFDTSSGDAPIIEVTLAQYSDAVAPDDADFLAQSNQAGSGDESDVVETTAEDESSLADNASNPLVADPLITQEAVEESSSALVSTVSAADDLTSTESDQETQEQLAALDTQNRTIEELAREIASLEARVALDADNRAKGPRIKRLTSVSTKTADEASYLDSWRKKVERVGNQRGLADVYGNLRMLVVIRADGSLQEVRILESSGKPVLDEAALRIVRQGAPYPPFTVAMSKNYEVLEIIRTWRFEPRGNSLGI